MSLAERLSSKFHICPRSFASRPSISSYTSTTFVIYDFQTWEWPKHSRNFVFSITGRCFYLEISLTLLLINILTITDGKQVGHTSFTSLTFQCSCWQYYQYLVLAFRQDIFHLNPPTSHEESTENITNSESIHKSKFTPSERVQHLLKNYRFFYLLSI